MSMNQVECHVRVQPQPTNGSAALNVGSAAAGWLNNQLRFVRSRPGAPRS